MKVAEMQAKAAAMTKEEWLQTGREHTAHKRFVAKCIFCESERELNRVIGRVFR